MRTPLPRGLAVVTGGTAGIGLSFAEQLAARGHDLLLVARDELRLASVSRRLAADHDVTVETLVADLADRDGQRTLEQRLADPDRPVALLVNNAGFGLKAPLLDNDVEAEQQMLDVLVTAVMRLTHAALGAMVERGEGAVVNVSSVAGFLPRGTYGASKSYVTALSEWADLTYRARGVRVMAVLPRLRAHRVPRADGRRLRLRARLLVAGRRRPRARRPGRPRGGPAGLGAQQAVQGDQHRGPARAARAARRAAGLGRR